MTPLFPYLLAAVVTLVPSDASRRSGCEAHVVDARGERVAPCGAAIETSGTAFGWIESATSITPFLTDVSQAGEYALAGNVAAGTVMFPDGEKLANGERIRLVSLATPRDETSLRALFARDVTSLDAKPRMPAGRAVALLIDAKGRTIAASPIATIRPGIETTIWPRTDGMSTLVAWLKRPRVIEREDQDAVALTASDATDTHEPAAVVNAADAVFAVWYDLPGRSARLVVDSAALRLERDTVDIARGSLTMVDAPLSVLPALTVTITATDAASIPTPMSLTIAEAAREEKAIRNLLVEPGKTTTIEALPASLLILALHIGDSVLQKRADLTSGIDTRLDIALEPLIVSGTVYLGDAPARAIVQVQQKEKPVSVMTDDRGAYAITLWQPQRYVIDTVLAEHPATPPYSQLVRITGSTTLNIHIPENRIRARVYDASTGKSIERGEMFIHNRWTAESRQHAAVQSVAVAGEFTPLPPQREGTSEIRVRAAGYVDPDPVVVAVDASLREHIIDIPMTPAASTTGLWIRLDGVRPAAGAEMAAWSGEQLLWSGTADETGRIALPDDVARKRLLVRHPLAASDVVVFGTLSDSETLSLSSAAPPLIVRVVRKDGSSVGPSPARISLWLTGGVRLSGAEAGFATWSFGATSPDGTTVLKGLWPKPLRLFATRSASIEQIRTGTFDGLAVTVPYPWPAVADVPLLDE